MLVTLLVVKDVKSAPLEPTMISNLQYLAPSAHQDKIPPKQEAPEEQIVIKLVNKSNFKLVLFLLL